MDLFMLAGLALYLAFSGLFGYTIYKTVFQRKGEIKAKFFAMRPFSVLILIIQLLLLYIAYFNLVYADEFLRKILGLAIGLPFLGISASYFFATILPEYMYFGNKVIDLKEVKKVYPDERKKSVKLVILFNNGKKTALLFSKKHYPEVKSFFGKKVKK
ncbi:MAG: hypothetical protein ACRC7N_20500 [Clostridium sp.]